MSDDKDMEKLLADFGVDNDASDDDSSSSSDSSDEAKRDVDLDDNTLDHIVLAAPEMEAALKEFEDMCGIKPKYIGQMKGLGLKNARISFSGSSFIEIVTPNPEMGGPVGTQLAEAGLSGLTPFHYAIRNEKCEEYKKEMQKLGYTPDHISMFGAKQDGTPRKWEMLHLYGHKSGGMCPFIINWATTDHPCESIPIVGDLKYCKVSAPDDDLLHKLYDKLEPDGVSLSTGPLHFEFAFDSPEGEVKFESSNMIGFRFPGFEDK